MNRNRITGQLTSYLQNSSKPVLNLGTGSLYCNYFTVIIKIRCNYNHFSIEISSIFPSIEKSQFRQQKGRRIISEKA